MAGCCGMAGRRMRRGWWLAGVGALAAGAAVGLVTQAGAFQPEEGMDAGEQEWLAGEQPGEHHHHLEALVGTWDFVMTFDDGTGMQEMKGTSKNEMIMDGRFLQQDVTSNFMGMPFVGRSTIGYSAPFHKYQGTWVDNMTTTIVPFEGECSEDGKVLTLTGKEPSMMGEGEQEFRDTMTIVDKDHTTFERVMVIGGQEVPGFTIKYTRRK